MRLDKQEPLVTIDDFVSTYNKPDSYQCRDSIDYLVDRGHLPLYYNSSQLEDINILAAWLLWSGSISNYQAGISVQPEHRKSVRDAARRLGIKMIERKNELVFGKGGKPYGRLIALLGIPNGKGTKKDCDRKIKQTIKLPPYVKLLIDNYSCFRKESRRIATKILADQCKVLFFSRLRWNGSYVLQTISSRNKKSAEKLAEQIVRMFNTVYPNMTLGEDSISTSYIRARRYYISTIIFRLETIFEGIRSYDLFTLGINPEYYVKGRRITQKRG